MQRRPVPRKATGQDAAERLRMQRDLDCHAAGREGGSGIKGAGQIIGDEGKLHGKGFLIARMMS